eukprot:scaffold4142_cov162-Pinguiococcus_pyrenoidosus.AAC.1
MYDVLEEFGRGVQEESSTCFWTPLVPDRRGCALAHLRDAHVGIAPLVLGEQAPSMPANAFRLALRVHVGFGLLVL